MAYFKWKDRRKLKKRIYIRIGARGNLIIDYVIINKDIYDRIFGLRIRENEANIILLVEEKWKKM